jgi:hypothetical protein
MSTYKRGLNLVARPLIIEEGKDQLALPATIDSFMSKVPEKVREKVQEDTRLFLRARQIAGVGYLAMGQYLSEARAILEPLKLWKEYINCFPNFSQPTAYRMIWAYENGQKMLPPATLKVAAAEGYKIVENRKSGGFVGKFGAAFKRVEKRLGPAPKEDEDKAKEFLRAVMEEKKKMTVRIFTGNQRTWTISIAAELQRKLTHLVIRQLQRVPVDKRPKFVSELTAELLRTVRPDALAA